MGLEDVFASVDREPLATASIAQVGRWPKLAERCLLPADRLGAAAGALHGCHARRAQRGGGGGVVCVCGGGPLGKPPAVHPHLIQLLAATAAQVHAAVLRGSNKEVVIKVLKPGVEDVLTTGGCASLPPAGKAPPLRRRAMSKQS